MSFLDTQKRELDGKRLAEAEMKFLVNRMKEQAINNEAARQYWNGLHRQGLADVMSSGMNRSVNDGRATTSQGFMDTGAPKFIPEGQGLYDRTIKGGR